MQSKTPEPSVGLKILAATLWAPIPLSLYFIVGSILGDGAIYFAIVPLVIGWLVTGLVGVPVVLALRRVGLARWWVVVPVGAVLGAVFFLTLFGVVLTVDRMLLYYSGCGAVTAATFQFVLWLQRPSIYRSRS